MALIENDVIVITNHGRMPAFAACPDAPGAFPGIMTDEEEDSSHLFLDRVQGELYYAFAETDGSVPDHVIPDLFAALETAGTNHTLKIFPGTGHGYLFAERMSYAPVAAEKTWGEMFDL